MSAHTDLSLEIAPQNIMTPVGSDIGLSLAVFNGKLYAAWRGSIGDQRMWYSSFDGTSWMPQQLMPDPFASTHGPTLATLHGSMYAVWKGSGGDVHLWYSRFDGTSWSPQQHVGGHCSSNGAGLATFRGALSIAYKGAPGYAPDAIWWTSFNGSVLSDNPMSDLVTSERPALGVWGEGPEQKLVIVYKGNGVDETIYYTTLDGSSWAPKQPLGGITSSGPAMVNYRGHLYAAWKGAGEDGGIWYSTYNGSTWSAPKSLPTPCPAGVGPSLAVFNDQLYVAWKGWDTRIWWTRTSPTGVMGQIADTTTIDTAAMSHPVPPMPAGNPTVVGEPSTHAHVRRSSDSSSSSDDLRRLKKGVKKGVAELSDKFRAKWKLGS